MTIETRFSRDEIILLTTLPSMVGSTIAMAGSSGVIGTFKEALANAKGVVAGIRSYPDNELIQGLLPNLEDRGQALEKAKQMRDDALQRLEKQDIDTKDKFREQTLNDCHIVRTLLHAKATPQESAEYRAWTIAVAEKVAIAAKEGSFLGFGGERVSEEERHLLQELSTALDTPLGAT